VGVSETRNFADKEEVGLHALTLALEEELSGELGASTIDADLLGRELRLRPGDKVHKDTFDYVCQVTPHANSFFNRSCSNKQQQRSMAVSRCGVCDVVT